MFVKGVNLGNWLVLEKWMSPALFADTTAEDEYHLPQCLPEDVYKARIKVHRSEYISERDFAQIKAFGLDTVRIPVPYFVFGDCPPFLGCIEELDHAFGWAEKYDLGILLDLHTAPDSQNGFDNGGICGVCKWAQSKENVEFVLNVLEKLAERYGSRKSFWGIEPLNEPITEPMWSMMKIQERYVPADPEKAKGSAPLTLEFIEQFYTDAYFRVRKHLPEDKYFVIHDAFHLKHWKNFMQGEPFHHVVLDTHQYLMLAEALGCEQTLNGYIEYIQENYAEDIAEMQRYFPVVCGEWCLFNSHACGFDTQGGQTVLNGLERDGENAVPEEKKKHLYSQLANAQLAAWQNGSGYFYWSYKLLLDTVNRPEWRGWDSWDLGKCISMGWFPVEN